ncbi:MAG: hypothetical protein U5K00_22925 [Melioribacteraceae bacterium]|nr:hypothetical protein [Melioribacteraceae bacterium]
MAANKKTHETSFQENVLNFFDKAGALTKHPKGLLDQIRQTNSIYRMIFPIRTGKNKYDVIEAYRAEHSHHKSR